MKLKVKLVRLLHNTQTKEKEESCNLFLLSKSWKNFYDVVVFGSKFKKCNLSIIYT